MLQWCQTITYFLNYKKMKHRIEMICLVRGFQRYCEKWISVDTLAWPHPRQRQITPILATNKEVLVFYWRATSGASSGAKLQMRAVSRMKSMKSFYDIYRHRMWQTGKGCQPAERNEGFKQIHCWLHCPTSSRFESFMDPNTTIVIFLFEFKDLLKLDYCIISNKLYN